MATQLQLRKGTKIQNDAFTGAEAELTYVTDSKGLRIHDGTTVGGIEVPTSATADYVVESQLPTVDNNYTWYRKYKSGWVEQGGSADTTQSVANTITIILPVEMSDTRYTVVGMEYSSGNGTGGYTNPGFCNKTTTSFDFRGVAASSITANNYDWEVKGMAA